MKSGSCLLGAALLVAAGPAGAAVAGSPQFCPALKRLVEAAAESPSFNSVADSRGHGLVTLGDLTDCNALIGLSLADRYVCQSGEMTPKAATALAVALQPHMAACFGQPGVPGDASKSEMWFRVGGVPSVKVSVLTGNAGKVVALTVSIQRPG
jgi:hypothetical protein